MGNGQELLPEKSLSHKGLVLAGAGLQQWEADILLFQLRRTLSHPGDLQQTLTLGDSAAKL